MWKKLILVLAVCVLLPGLGNGQEPKAALDGVVKAMGDVKSLQYAGNGAYFFLGQSVSPGAPPPRFNLKSYTRIVDYDTPSMRDEFVRTQAEPGARGGGGGPAGWRAAAAPVGKRHAGLEPGGRSSPNPAAGGRCRPPASALDHPTWGHQGGHEVQRHRRDPDGGWQKDDD